MRIPKLCVHALSLGALWILSCVPAAPPVEPVAGRGFGSSAGEREQAPQPFEVSFFGPVGESTVDQEVSLVFSRPMRRLGQAGEAVELPITIRPMPPGHFSWLGTQAVVFVPDQGRLPYGNEFVVEVPAGLTAVDGSRLEKATRFTFATPTPKPSFEVRTDGEEQALSPNSRFRVGFTQPVSAERLRERLSLLVGGKKTEITVRALPPSEHPHGFEVVPVRPLPANQSVELVVAKGLVGEEGPRSTVEEFRGSYRSYGPLLLREVSCWQLEGKSTCDAQGSLGVAFTNPVRGRNLVGRVAFGNKPRKLPAWVSPNDTVRELWFDGPFTPGSALEVRAAAGLCDVYGQCLKQAATKSVVFDDLMPRVVVGATGDVIELGRSAEVPLGSLNVKELEVVSGAVSVEDLWRDGAEKLVARALDDAPDRHPGLTKSKLTASVPKNQLFVKWLGLEHGSSQTGISLLGLRYTVAEGKEPAEPLTQAMAFVRTDIGISAHIGRFGGYVWVTRLSDGTPRRGAFVGVLTRGAKPAAELVTDADGLVTLPKELLPERVFDEPKADAALVVRDGRDHAWVRLRDLIGEWRMGVLADRDARPGLRAVVFSERPIYRPGEKLYAQALVRREELRELSVAVGQPVTFSLSSPSGKLVAKRSLTTNRFGSASVELLVPATAELGEYSLELEMTGERRRATHRVVVAAFRGAELEVAVKPAQSLLVRGTRLRLDVDAKTLFGMPVGGQEARFEARYAPMTFLPPGEPDVVTDARSYHEGQRTPYLTHGVLRAERVTLDEQGRARMELGTEGVPGGGPERLDLEAEVSDSTQNPALGTASVQVFPADGVVGIKRPESGFFAARSQQAFLVSVFSPEGRRLLGRAIEGELIRRTWVSAERVGEGGTTTETEMVDTVVDRCTAVSAERGAPCRVTLPEAGFYLFLARARDRQNRLSQASVSVFAGGATESGWGEKDPHGIELVPDKPSYRVGDTAQILVRANLGETRGVMAVARADVHSVKLVELSGSSPMLSVPITEASRPNVFVSLHLVSGRKGTPKPRSNQPDLGAPGYRIGWTELRVDSSDRRLTVELEPKAREARPGEELEVSARLRDPEGRPVQGEATLWAVDEAVLALMEADAIDPSRSFFEPRPLGLLALENREQLSTASERLLREMLGLSKGEAGGGGGMSPPGAGLRRDFRPTVFFAPGLATDGNGAVKTKFRLPDSVTRYRLFALGTSGADRFGFTEGAITATKPLVIRPMVPRFLGLSDRLEVGAVVSAPKLERARVRIGLSGTGFLPRRAESTVVLEPESSQHVRFPVEITEPTRVKLELSAEAFDERTGQTLASDRVWLERPVRAPLAWEVVATSGVVAGKVKERLGELSAMRPDVGELEVKVHQSLVGGAAFSLERLAAYPHRCTEQLASKVIGLVAEQLLSGKSDKAPITEDLEAILARQRADGGFSLWPEQSRSDPWSSIHASRALGLAKKLGISVEPEVEKRARQYLHERLREAAPADNDHARRLSQTLSAAAADVLCTLGDPDLAGMSRLSLVQNELLDHAQAFLLSAYAGCARDAEATELLLRELRNRIAVDGRLARVRSRHPATQPELMDSATRTTALVVRAVLMAEPRHQLARPLVMGLLEERRDGAWATPEETAFALLALMAAETGNDPSSAPVRIRVGLGEQGTGPYVPLGAYPGSRSFRFPRSALASNQALLLESEGGRELSYEAVLRSLPKTLTSTPKEAGFAIQRELFVLEPRTAGQSEQKRRPVTGAVAVGEILEARLTVVIPRPRDYVVIEDPLAAGLESIDTQLGTTGAWLRDAEKAEQAGYGASAPRRELYDDRTVMFVDHAAPGIYRYRTLLRATHRGSSTAAPARVESMVYPELFGTTEPRLIDVR